MIVQVQESNIRIDKYLSDNTDFSRSYISKLIESGLVKVNGSIPKDSYKVKINDVIAIEDNLLSDNSILPYDLKLDIVYENDNLIIINKPSGLTVHPGAGNKDKTLVNALVSYTNNLSLVNSERPGIVHRLDKDTSGLMVVAKNNKAHELLSYMFEKHEIKRTYIALLCGVVPFNKAVIDVPIKRDDKDFEKMMACSDGKKAITHLEVLKRYNKYTLVKLNLETGRTHQIRVHMAYLGYPVYNDPVYNNKKASEFGQFLHSSVIDFEEPITHEKLHFEAELPEEFQRFIDNLE